MVEVDRIMIEDLGIELIQMVENAGRNLAQLALLRYRPESVVVLAGRGGNGGGGLVAARHLYNHGVAVTLCLTRERSAFRGVPEHQLAIVERMGLALVDEPPPGDLVIDAMVGYSLAGDLSGREADLTRWANSEASPVLALDIPSGVAADGYGGGVAVDADATMTLALPKDGLRAADGIGELFVADISVPRSVWNRLGVSSPTFGDSWLLQVV